MLQMPESVVSALRSFSFRGKARLLNLFAPKSGIKRARIFQSLFELDCADFIQRQIYLGVFERHETIVLAKARDTSSVGISTRIPELDGFRGLAILLVVAGHALVFTFHVLTYQGLKIAELGVLLFFVLSGFLITGLLRSEEGRTGDISLGNFYKRRAFRLLPALAVFLAVVAVLRRVGWVTDVPTKDFVAAIFYLRDIIGRSGSLGHLWSLSLEEQFYMIWPLLFLYFGGKRMPRVALGLSLLVMAWRGLAIYFHLWNYDAGVFYIRPWFRFDSIAVGCWLALVRLPKRERWVFPAAAAALLAWAMYGEQISHVFFITLETVLAAALLFSVVHGTKTTRWLFSASPLRWLGKISYSLYLWQQLFLVSSMGPAWVHLVPVNILLALALAVLSHYFIEQPCLSLGRRFLTSTSHVEVAEPAVV